MSKGRASYRLYLGLLGSAAVIALGFQNCSRVSSFNTASSSVAADSGPITTIAPAPPDTPTTPKALSATSFKPELVDRYYLDSLFTDVFGPTAVTVNTAKSGTDGGSNGGLCGIYEQYKAYNATAKVYAIVDRMAGCTLTSVNAQTDPNANETVTRQALLIRACSDLTNNAATLKYAMGKIASGATPPVSSATLLTAFHLFYRLHPDPDPAVLQSLQLLFPDPTQPTSAGWHDVLYTICSSSLWQVI